MRRRSLSLLLGCLMLMTSGCWDMEPLDRRAFVVMAGIDRTPEGLFRVSAQVQTAGMITQRGHQKGSTPGVRVVTSQAQTLQMAMALIRGQFARELDLTFLDVIVVGRNVATDLRDMDWVIRAFPVPIHAYVALAMDQAESVVRAPAAGFGIPAQFALFGYSGVWTRTPEVVPARSWLVFNRNWFTPLEDSYLPALEVGDDGLTFAGLGVFRNNRLVGLLNKHDSTLVSLLLGVRNERAVEARVSEDPPAVASVYLWRTSVKRKVTWQGNRPVIHVTLEGRGNLRELIGMHVVTPQDQALVEGVLAERLADDTVMMLRRLQELGADPIGFGELARQASPYRAEVQSGDAWHQAYRKAELDVRARVTIEATGYLK